MRLLEIFRHRFAWTAALVSVVTACSQTPPAVVQAKAKPKPAVQRTFDDAFVHPVPGARISSSFANYIVKSRNRKHHGTDFAAPIGTPVYATRSGVVLSADNTSLSGDFGNAVLIEHGDQFQSLSAHLSRIDVQMGTWVQAGQQIGLVGKTGRATGAHLHFELWQNNLPKDPLQFLPISESQRLAVKKPEPAASKTTPPRLAEVAASNSPAKGDKKSGKSVSKSTKAKQTNKVASTQRGQKQTSHRTTKQQKLVASTGKATNKKAATAKTSVTKQTVAKNTTGKSAAASKKTVAAANKPAGSSKTGNSTQLIKNTTQAPDDDKSPSQKKRGGMR